MQVSFSLRRSAPRTLVLPAPLLPPYRALLPSASFRILQQACPHSPSAHHRLHFSRHQASVPISLCFPCAGPSLVRCQTASPIPRLVLKTAAHPAGETASAPLHQIGPPVARSACRQIPVRAASIPSARHLSPHRDRVHR